MPDASFEQLEKECQKHSLTKIRIPHVLIDNHARQRSHRLAAVLMSCPELQTLDVKGTHIQFDGWRPIGEALAYCPKLQVLDVEQCRIANTPDNCENFALWLQVRAASLTKVNLGRNFLFRAEQQGTLHFITDALALCTRLEHVVLSNNDLQEQAAKILAPALNNCPHPVSYTHLTLPTIYSV